MRQCVFFPGGVLAAILATMALSPPARAQEPTANAACEGAAGRYVVAPSAAALLALATCHEQHGRTASAWAEYLEAATIAHREKRLEVEASAKSHAASVQPRLSTLAVRLAPGADVPGLDVRRDGIALGRATWGTAAPVDPGEHHVVATAPGRLPWRVTVVVQPASGAQSVDIGALEEASLPGVATLTSATMPGPAGDAPDRPASPARPGSTQRAAGLGTAGAGNTATFTFAQKGRYRYGSTSNGAMRGAIEVRP